MYSFEIEFHDSILSSVAVNDGTLELYFDMAILLVIDQFGTWLEKEYHVIPATVFIEDAKYKKLPKVGTIYHGDLYCIEEDKRFVGTIPLNLKVDSNISLYLTDYDGDLEIAGASFRIVVEMDNIPEQFRWIEN